MPFGKGFKLQRLRKNTSRSTRRLLDDVDVDEIDLAQNPKKRTRQTTTIVHPIDVINIHPTNDQDRRLAISFYFINTLNAPPEQVWSGCDGTISAIIKNFNLPLSSRETVRNILLQVMNCAKKGLKYCGNRLQGSGGHNKMIFHDSIEQQIIADAIEDGLGLRQATNLVNVYRNSKNKIHVGVTSIYSAYLRMQSTVSPIKAAKQGSSDVDSPWAVARLGWCTQLAIRLGIFQPTIQPCPEYFNLEKIGSISLTQLVHWDECHKIIEVGGHGAGGSKSQVRFPRDWNGRYDPNGILRPEKYFLNMKYTEESRFSLGCAIVELESHEIEGRRCNPFVYSEKWICTIPDWNDMKNREIARVQSLPGNGPPWVTGHRNKDNGIFMEDCISLLDGLGKTVAARFNSSGITTVHMISCLSDKEIKTISSNTPGITAAKLTRIRDFAKTAKSGAWNGRIINHKESENPYQSLYGSVWEFHLSKCAQMKKYVCVTELVKHIILESSLVMQGTIHENDWYFYHDALAQMTCSSTITWMKQVGYFKHWILPEQGLNAETRFAGRPVGNSPELMCWDSSLNKDVDDSFNYHRALTVQLPRDDPKKFCKSTTSRMDSGYLRLLDPSHGTAGVPSSERIIQDIQKCMGSHLLAIIKAKGAVVHGLGSRSGHRRIIGIQSQGGRREKSSSSTFSWTHPDAMSIVDEFLDKSVATYEQRNQ